MSGTLKFDKIRWGAAILAAVLLFGAVPVSAQDDLVFGKARYPRIDSITDNDSGTIQISWSLFVPDIFDGVHYLGNPDSITVYWNSQTGTGITGNTTFTDSSSTDPTNDLVVDLGMGSHTETYRVDIAVDYPNTSGPIFSEPQAGFIVMVSQPGDQGARPGQ